MDEKGRVAVPSRFREVLGGLGDERLVLAPFEDRGRRGLEAFPFSAWRRFEERLGENHPNDERTLDFIYMRVGHAADCLPDGQGRILVPPDLREHAGLKREVVFQGHLVTFRLWEPGVWNEARENARKVYQDGQLTTLKL